MGRLASRPVTVDKIRTFLHAPNPVNLAGALTLLRAHPQILVLHERYRHEADVLVVLEEAVTDETISAIRNFQDHAEARNQTRCVVVTDRFRPGDLLPALDSGVVSVMSLPEAPARLAAAILTAHDGTLRLPPQLQGALLVQLKRLQQHVLEPGGLTMSGLSTRECDVLRLLAEGLSTEEIAVRLNYSERTVKNILYALMTRLGLSNRSHAVAYAVRTGAI
jgi:DNA-binding NarL/FixJ family response regulator